LALLPASNFAEQFHPMADRYLYVPLAGFGLLAAALAHRLRIVCSSRLAGGLLGAVGLGLLFAEYAANLRRQIVWQEPATLWTDVLRQYPRTAPAHLGLANVHYRAGDYYAARAAAAEAVLMSGGRWGAAWALRAICEWQTGARAQAVESLRRARSLSRVYFDEQSAAAAMILSPEQISSLGEVLRAGGD
jgi:tetratricopeptide (TPR) repeat protein